VPSGGNKGTTSHNRPKLSEVGIDDGSIYDAEGKYRWGPHEISVGGQWVGLSGDDTLHQDLTSQAQTFPAGSRVHSDLTLDWYRAAYGYRLTWPEKEGFLERLTLTPRIGGDLLDFDFKLHSSGVASVSRNYLKGGLQVGLGAEYRLSPQWSIVGDVASSVPIPDTPFIVTAELLARYQFYDARSFSAAVEAGVGWEHIGFEDNQSVPNRIDVDLGPLLVVGVELKL
jgi:hypothetical protein